MNQERLSDSQVDAIAERMLSELDMDYESSHKQTNDNNEDDHTFNLEYITLDSDSSSASETEDEQNCGHGKTERDLTPTPTARMDKKTLPPPSAKDRIPLDDRKRHDIRQAMASVQLTSQPAWAKHLQDTDLLQLVERTIASSQTHLN